MADELNHKISQFLDDDLNYQESLNLLMAMKTQHDLQQKLQRYEAIGHALKAETLVPLDADFARRVSNSLQAEPIQLLPRRKVFTKFHASISALAASAALIAIIVSHEQSPHPDAQLLTAARPTQSILAVTPIVSEHTEPADPGDPTKNRFIDYLQAHNSSRYIGDSVALQSSYTRIVSYQQE